MPSIIEAWRAGLIRRDNLMRNIVAGVVVGVVAIPLAMAFAIASGARPEQGLYTALVAGLFVTLFGGSRVQIAGPTGAFAVLLVSITARYGFAGLQVVTLLAGIMLVLFGLTKLGNVVRFIPESVVLGFTCGISIVIWVGQWENFLGLPSVAGGPLYERLPRLLSALPHLDLPTAALGLVSLLIVLLWPRIPVAGKVPAPLVALVAGTGFVAVAHPESVATVGSAFGGFAAGLPRPLMPALDLATIIELLRPAFAIALLGAIESLLSATVADGMADTRHDSNQELIGQGVANIASAVFGGFAATGAIARTATNIRHGGDSPIAGIVHALVVLLVLVALAPLAYFVPLATLAAVLFVVAFHMSELGRVIRTVRRAPRSDVAVMLVTLGLTVLTDLTLAVEVGVILALLNFFRRMTGAVEVRSLDDTEIAEALPDGAEKNVPDGVLVYAIDGPFFFGAVERFQNALLHTGTDPDAVVISLSDVPFIDLTGLVTLREAVERLRERHVAVMLCGANGSVTRKLERVGIESADRSLAEALIAAESSARAAAAA